jgi:polygalacturonase
LAAKSGGDFNPFLSIKDGTDVTLTGKGTIEGNGAVWWEEAEKARQKQSGFTLPRPNLIVPTRITNLRITGITIQNSPKFHLVPTECENVWIEGIKILAPERAANTDAIDPSISRNVTVTNCLIDVGDDNIAIKAGRKVAGREAAVENFWVERCTFLHGHGMSIGSETLGGVKNLTVTNCTFNGTTSGIRIKSARGRGGVVENLVYTDITMTNVDYPIYLTSYYPKVPPEDAAQPLAPDSPVYRNIVIRNLTAHSAKTAGMIVGLPEAPIENVTLENVRVTAPTGLMFRNTRAIKLQNATVSPTKGGAPFILETNAVVEGLPKN